jgi:hypothetical protein
MWQRIAFVVPVILSGCFFVAVSRTAQVPAHPDDHMSIMVSSSDLPQLETEMRSVAAARNMTVDDRSAGSDTALDWELVKEGQFRISAVYDAYRSVVQICFFKADGAGNDYVADFKEALRLGLARR